MVNLPGNRSPASSFSPLDSKTQRIVLTGFMGAGKSTVGRLIADRVGWDFLDLDICIETSTGKNTRELFHALGESGFRELETDLWASVLQQSQVIIAPGGAVIDKPENQRILAGSAGTIVIFLDAPFNTLIDRCIRQEQGEGATYRPLLHKTEIALERYLERRVLYQKHAHRDISVADKAPEVVVQDILPFRAISEDGALTTICYFPRSLDPKRRLHWRMLLVVGAVVRCRVWSSSPP